MTRPVHTRIFLVLSAAACLAGCGLQKSSQPTSVLTTEDFIADPTTLPTQAGTTSDPGEVTPATPLPPVISVAAASEGILNVSAAPGAPGDSGAALSPSGPATLVDAKVGELNGRPVRAQQVLGELGPLLSAKARDRKLSRDEWAFFLYPRAPEPGSEDRTISRDQWLAFAQKAIAYRLNTELEDQLLAEEARFSLKPEQKQGLKYMVQEATETARREAGGARAESQKILREKGTSEREFARRRESLLLVGYELDEKLRKRIRTSWKDVRLYYDRNDAEFNPAPIAHFRRIDVPANTPEDAAAIQAALEAGEPFEQVASKPMNTYRASQGGRTPDQPFTGEYETASFFSGTLVEPARALKAGQHTKTPVDFSTDKSWLFLESIERHSRPLSDPEVQLTIANRLNNQAFRVERTNYIDRLKQRATFTDIPAMTMRLADIAAAMYWPQE